MTKPTKLAIAIGFCAILTGALALDARGLAAALLGWTSLGCAIATWAYTANRPELYGKRGGRLVWWRAAPSAIFLGAFRIACALMRIWRRHPAATEVVPGFWVAGRVGPADLPPHLDFIVDLVAEFPEPTALRQHPGYRFLPALDGGTPPNLAAVRELVAEVGEADARVLVHCDSGIGRAPTLAALVLVRRGQASTVDEAEALIQARRPFIHLGRADRAFLEQALPHVRRPKNQDLPAARAS